MQAPKPPKTLKTRAYSNRTEQSSVSMSPAVEDVNGLAVSPLSPSNSTAGDEFFVSLSPSPFTPPRVNVEISANGHARLASTSCSSAELLEHECYLEYISEETSQQNVDRAIEEDNRDNDDPISF